MEVLGLEHLVLLSKDEHNAPQVADQPRINRLVAAVGRHEDVGDLGQETLQGELLEVGCQSVLVDIHDLVRH